MRKICLSKHTFPLYHTIFEMYLKNAKLSNFFLKKVENNIYFTLDINKSDINKRGQSIFEEHFDLMEIKHESHIFRLQLRRKRRHDSWSMH